MNTYKKINIIIGWIVFAISAIVYLLTIEPTVSFWDCGEFISSGFKLEVGHPPGAPFFMLLARFASLFALGDVTKVAKMVNSFSAIVSAFTILFLFWSITHLAKKILCKSAEITTLQIIAIMGSGFVGALSYTFSDTFWFSAVEGEVYATSSFFTAIVFWSILKWENEAGQKHANRWLVLIAYLMGLSIGVHLLNLLAIPAIVLVYYFKKYKPTKKGVVLAMLISVLILGGIMYGIIQGFVTFGSYFELFFVNVVGLPYNSGIFIYLFFIITLLYIGIRFSILKGKYILNTIFVCIMVILIGYSSYGIIIIRSSADTPMDQNNPDNVFSLLYYLNREQYGDRPLLYGQYYNANVIDTKNEKPSYTQIDKKYKVTAYKPKYIYDDKFCTAFPRMHSSEPSHIEIYKKFGKIKGRRVTMLDESGKQYDEFIPTFGENLRFFFNYQVGFMYFRYFMWNFAGRQNDIQGHGNDIHGNWISGIKFIDEARLGSQSKLPDEYKKNKGRNVLYMLPLLLGIIGLIFHFKKDKKDFWIVSLLFVLTGLAIVVYLNQTPLQPRERDYAYAGSFYAFAIWIGLGVLALIDMIGKKLPQSISAISVTILCIICVPALMAKENWDDHDRSGRFTALDFSYNYLNSCDENAVLFTNGDNDTFPLWYAQEVEGVRTDVRVSNLSYIGADWYIDQMKRKAYTSDPLPISLTKDKYLQGNRDVVYISNQFDKYINLEEAIRFVASDDPRTKQQDRSGEMISYLPSKKYFIPVDSTTVLEKGIVDEKFRNKILPEIPFILNKNYIIKNDLIVLDILATNQWKRPIYFAITVSGENYLGLDNYFLNSGLAYKLIPVQFKSEMGEPGGIDVDKMYDNVMNKFRWGKIYDPNIYMNEDNRRMLINYRSLFGRLAKELIDLGRKDSALKVLDKCMTIITKEQVPYKYFEISIAESYYKLGENKKGKTIIDDFWKMTRQSLDYFIDLGKHSEELDYDKKLSLHVMQEMLRVLSQYEKIETVQEKDKEFKNYINIVSPTLKNE